MEPERTIDSQPKFSCCLRADSFAPHQLAFAVQKLRLIPAVERSGLQTLTATENVSLPKKFRPPGQRSFMEGFSKP
jgi:hypothetical protein